MMVGGDYAPGVQTLLNDILKTISKPPTPGQFQPLDWGYIYYRVVNPGGGQADAGWNRLRLF